MAEVYACLEYIGDLGFEALVPPSTAPKPAPRGPKPASGSQRAAGPSSWDRKPAGSSSWDRKPSGQPAWDRKPARPASGQGYGTQEGARSWDFRSDGVRSMAPPDDYGPYGPGAGEPKPPPSRSAARGASGPGRTAGPQARPPAQTAQDGPYPPSPGPSAQDGPYGPPASRPPQNGPYGRPGAQPAQDGSFTSYGGPRARTGATGPGDPAERRADPSAAPQTPDATWVKEARSLEELYRGLEDCRLCPLHVGRRKSFPGRGPKGAKVMFVVEPPDLANAEVESLPYGPMGELLGDIIAKGLRLAPEDCYITPLVKCPVEDPEDSGPFRHRPCASIVLREVELAAPESILALGLLPSQALLARDEVMARLRLKKTTLGPARVPVRATFGLLAMVAMPVLKKEVWRDMKEFFRLG